MKEVFEMQNQDVVCFFLALSHYNSLGASV